MNDAIERRKLTAILSADVQGYSRLMGDDEAMTVKTITRYRQVFAQAIKAHDIDNYPKEKKASL